MKPSSLAGSPLGLFIRENMPRLYAELAALPTMDACRERLNLETGLQISPSDPVERSIVQYLEALICIKVIMENLPKKPAQSRGLAQWVDKPDKMKAISAPDNP